MQIHYEPVDLAERLARLAVACRPRILEAPGRLDDVRRAARRVLRRAPARVRACPRLVADAPGFGAARAGGHGPHPVRRGVAATATSPRRPEPRAVAGRGQRTGSEPDPHRRAVPPRAAHRRRARRLRRWPGAQAPAAGARGRAWSADISREVRRMAWTRCQRRAMARLSLACAAAFLALAPAASAASDTAGKTTVQQTIRGANGPGYDALGLGPGLSYVVRGQAGAAAQSGREQRRRSLLYFAQLTDFQLADEESPARVEFARRRQHARSPRPGARRRRSRRSSSTRRSARSTASPTPARSRRRGRAHGLALTTGDSADNQQRNEAKWVVRLLEGGDARSQLRREDGRRAGCPARGQRATPGVQDYDDYPPATTPSTTPTAERPWAAWPRTPA